ncbi:hypothetical protein ISO42_17375 [Morganella morganii subsp. morganii]|uniref:hypothetical protein n=1 Tax=Morganella morganii TaxID=582 RepID=UPI001BDA8B94|nr:hypothetical protein [Morganella morganii]MBT0513825.1 hypothetical protein [Morganella morganii subsp. morganii]UNJ80361.1 hypothetical protein [Morganella morganii]
MNKLLVIMTLLFPILSVGANVSTTNINKIKELNDLAERKERVDNVSFLITYNYVNKFITTNVTPVENMDLCERLKVVLENDKKRIKTEMYNGYIENRFECLTVEYND